MNHNSFDNIYERTTDFYFTLQPCDTVVKFLEVVNPNGGRALDLGCGEGRDSILLARSGFSVTAIDISEPALEKLRALAMKEHLDITCLLQDAVVYDYPSDAYDVVVATTLLDHLPLGSSPAVVEGIKKTLRKSGHCCVTVFTTEDPGCQDSREFRRGKTFSKPSDCARMVVHYFTPNELLRNFVDLRVIYYLEELYLDTKHGQTHYHGVARLVARKL